MSDLEQKDFLKEIVSLLKDINKGSPALPSQIDLKENERDISSKNLFKDLYINLLYYYKLNQRTKIETEEQEYFYSALADIFFIIYESDPDYCKESIEIKLSFIYLIDFFKESKIINLEVICKIFFNLKNSINNIGNKKILTEVCKFEENVSETIKICLQKYISDYEIEIKNANNLNDFSSIMMSLDSLEEESFPLHLKGFIEYNKKKPPAKLLIIKIYEYVEKINPYKYDPKNENFHLFQGFSLYEIITYNRYKNPMINIKEFIRIKKNRINNIYAKKILELSIKVLKLKANNELKDILINEKIDSNAACPKISKEFKNTEAYYQDLYKQLEYYLKEFMVDSRSKICKIILKENYRVLWLNFAKTLLLNLGQKDIEKENIKLIFYFIVILFNPKLDYQISIVFKEDIVPILFSQCEIPDMLLENQNILQLLDKDYSQYYTKSTEEINFNLKIIDSINKNIKEEYDMKNLCKNDKIKNAEVNQILKYNGKLPFPLLHHYIEKLGNIIINRNIKLPYFNFYRNCFCDLDNNQ